MQRLVPPAHSGVMHGKAAQHDTYLIAIILLSVAYFSCMALLQNYWYQSFQAPFYDLGTFTYSNYWHLHSAAGTNAMQMLVFSDHVCPICFAFLPAFALSQQPISLIVFQEALLALTSIAVYLVCRELLKSRRLGFALALAFVINAGIRGLALGNVHPQAFIPLFYLLSFHFYFKENLRYFAVSYFLLLSVYESTFAVGFALLLALLLYELFYNFRAARFSFTLENRRAAMLLSGFSLTVLAFLFYGFAVHSILASYPGTPYSVLPPITRLIDYNALQLTALSSLGSQPYDAFFLYVFGIWGGLLLFFGFGPFTLASVVLTAVLLSPWLAEVFLLHNAYFIYPFSQYYSYAVSGSLLAAIFGLWFISRKRLVTRNRALRVVIGSIRNAPEAYIVILALIFSVSSVLFATILLPGISKPANYAQLPAALNLIPSDASVMAQVPIAAHLFYIKNLELFPAEYPNFFLPVNYTLDWFTPQYVVADKNLSDYGSFLSSKFGNPNYTRGNYTQVYNSSGIVILRSVASH